MCGLRANSSTTVVSTTPIVMTDRQSRFTGGWISGCSVLIFLFTLVLGGLTTTSASDEVAKKLLKDYWSHTRKKQTDQYYDSQEHKNRNAIYAYALVKSRQHDVKKALAAIESLHAIDDTNPQSWRLKVWLQLRYDKYNAAAVSLGKYIEKVKADKKLDDFSRADAYRFAGRVFGYLEGPVKRHISTVTVETIKGRILHKLDADLLNSFTLEYTAVEHQFNKLNGAKLKHEANFAEQDEKERKIKFTQLTQVEQQLSKTKEQLEEQSGTIRNAANQELEELRRMDLPLATRSADLESELGQVNAQLIFFINDYNYWNNLALREGDPALRALYFRRAGRADGLIIQQELVASSIRRELSAIDALRRALRQQYASTTASASNQLAAINRTKSNIAKQQHRTNMQKLKTTKPTKKIITHAVALKSKSQSIVTYDQFPLEIERQLLLDQLK